MCRHHKKTNKPVFHTFQLCSFLHVPLNIGVSYSNEFKEVQCGSNEGHTHTNFLFSHMLRTCSLICHM